jgi:hypothetical protein
MSSKVFKLAIAVIAGLVLSAGMAAAQVANLDASTAPLSAKASLDKTAPPRRTIPNPSPDAVKPPSLSLSPAVVVTQGSVGQSITQNLVLTNGTARDMAFDMVAEDVVVRDGRRVFVPAGELKGSIAATAVFSTPTVTVKPFSSTSVDVRFTMPAGSDIRGVVAIFRGTNKVPSATRGVAMTASMGTLITFTMSKDFQVAADPIKTFDQSDVANAMISEWLTNTGSEPIIPEGMVAVLDDSGALVSKAPLPAQRLMPGERLEFKAECASTLPSGHYRVLASYQFEGKTITKAGELVVR